MRSEMRGAGWQAVVVVVVWVRACVCICVRVCDFSFIWVCTLIPYQLFLYLLYHRVGKNESGNYENTLFIYFSNFRAITAILLTWGRLIGNLRSPYYTVNMIVKFNTFLLSKLLKTGAERERRWALCPVELIMKRETKNSCIQNESEPPPQWEFSLLGKAPFKIFIPVFD